MGKISALEAGRSGFQWGFGPCVDVDRIIEISSAVITETIFGTVSAD